MIYFISIYPYVLENMRMKGLSSQNDIQIQKETMKKTYKKLEKIVRGFSNYRRIQIIELLAINKDLSVFEISEKLNVSFKTISGHMIRLEASGIIYKKTDLSSVRHGLTDRGKLTLKFLKKI